MLLRTSVSRTAAFIGPCRAAAFSTTTRAMAEGDVGAPPKAGGSNAFSRREKASEDMAIRQREKEKLLELKKQLNEQKQHLDRLSEHIDQITKAKDSPDGEKN
ncbi:hypothetical protein CDD80_7023 [Ophiocordyceps camponoti-rufipedis]|uniref:ATPase inhibitor, mitochondrial n=1 Tax=Ophiocordyceps camponoti-rufipedis TaxID=2004952 RepID=A0A2C5ZBD3_9HYPO|nr:hypothetical protein CDD80_7023 [Ophiocordyceps camponoti-rufipedis]